MTFATSRNLARAVHRIASVEVLEGDYLAPPLTGEETAAELRFEELSWIAEVGAARVSLAVLSHGELDAVEHRCDDYAYLTDAETAWEDHPWAHVAADEDIGRPTIAFDGAVSDITPVFFDHGPTDDRGGEIERPLVLDVDRLGFVLAADYQVRPSGCTDATCTSTVRVRHHFRRPDGP